MISTRIQAWSRVLVLPVALIFSAAERICEKPPPSKAAYGISAKVFFSVLKIAIVWGLMKKVPKSFKDLGTPSMSGCKYARLETSGIALA